MDEYQLLTAKLPKKEATADDKKYRLLQLLEQQKRKKIFRVNIPYKPGYCIQITYYVKPDIFCI